MMPATDVVTLVSRLLDAGMRVWLDGGWAIDAALGQQTREHDDLDLTVLMDELERITTLLAPDGFTVTGGELPTSLVLADGARRLDLHPITFDEDGGGIQLLPDGSPWRYPPEGFDGHGVVEGVTLPCLTPEVQLLCHTGYEPDAQDRRDIALLCARFNLELPEGYR